MLIEYQEFNRRESQRAQRIRREMENLSQNPELGSFSRYWAVGTEMSNHLNRLTHDVIGAAIEVHRHLGPGLLESAYKVCLCRELVNRGIPFEIEKALPVEYKGQHLDCGYRLDLLVEKQLVVEVKSVEGLAPIHEAQLLTYLQLGGWKVGLLINFNVLVLKDGIRRRVLQFKE